jgi:hypothetical protein
MYKFWCCNPYQLKGLCGFLIDERDCNAAESVDFIYAASPSETAAGLDIGPQSSLAEAIKIGRTIGADPNQLLPSTSALCVVPDMRRCGRTQQK